MVDGLYAADPEAAILVLHKDLGGEGRYLRLLRSAQFGRDRKGAATPETDDNRQAMKANAQLLERSAMILAICLQDETLQTIYEDRWVRAFSRDPEVIAAGRVWKLGR